MVMKKHEYLNALDSFKSLAESVPFNANPGMSSVNLRKEVVNFCGHLRRLSGAILVEPSLTSSFKGNIYTIKFTRREESLYYPAFSVQGSAVSEEVRSLRGLIVELYVKLYSEYLLKGVLEEVNALYRSFDSSFSVSFVSDVFEKRSLVHISDESVVFKADTSMVLNLGTMVGSIKDYTLSEKHYLETAYSTVHLIAKRSPLVQYLTGLGKVGPLKLLTPLTNKTINILKVYPTSTGKAYYHQDGFYGIVERGEFGSSVILSPTSLTTYLVNPDVDILEGVS